MAKFADFRATLDPPVFDSPVIYEMVLNGGGTKYYVTLGELAKILQCHNDGTPRDAPCQVFSIVASAIPKEYKDKGTLFIDFTKLSSVSYFPTDNKVPVPPPPAPTK